jgi:hypothetical protein
MRNGKTFQLQIENLPTICPPSFLDQSHNVVLCSEGIVVTYGNCEQPVEITVCEGTPSQQTLVCCLPLDYLEMQGELELLFNIYGICNSNCYPEPVEAVYHAVAQVQVEELCYYCEGTRPDLDNGDLCPYFTIIIDNVSETGLITYTVTFVGCPTPIE